MQLVSSPAAQRNLARFAAYAARQVQALIGAFRLFRQGTRDGIDLLAKYDALSRLSDHALAKRGLTRDEIARAALDASDRHR